MTNVLHTTADRPNCRLNLNVIYSPTYAIIIVKVK